MEMVEITIKVPKDYVDEAADFGMLEPEILGRILRDELDKRIMKFVDDEVKAHRAEQRAKQSQDNPA